MQILVVEDDVELARLVSSALIEAGHDTIFVHDREGALDRAKGARLDLVVLDVILPGMDGFDVKAARADNGSNNTCDKSDDADHPCEPR
jgi:DNA-binding response OmpR family regulator